MRRRSLIIGILCLTIVIGSAPVNSERITASGLATKLRIIYSNDTYGYLEPCGCGGANEGGLARRTTIISQLVKENPNCVIVESGNIASDKINVGIITDLLGGMGYNAIGIGRYDIPLLGDLLKQTARRKITVVDALLPPGPYVAPYLIKNIGGVKVGIVSFGYDGLYSFKATPEAEKAFCDAFKQARDKSDVLIMLDQGMIGLQDWLVSNKATLGMPDVIIGGAAYSSFPLDVTVWQTHIVPTSVKGRRIGVVDVEVMADRSLNVSKRTIAIDGTIAEDKTVNKKIDDFLSGLGFKRTAPPTTISGVKKQGTYVPPEQCKTCHAEQYEDWRATKHAAAIGTLITKKRLIADCLPCHSEEYRQTSDLAHPPSADVPLGVECATCHASVLPHGKNGPARSAVRKVDPMLCLTCHNSERSSNYDEKTYLPRVSHMNNSFTNY